MNGEIKVLDEPRIQQTADGTTNHILAHRQELIEGSDEQHRNVPIGVIAVYPCEKDIYHFDSGEYAYSKPYTSVVGYVDPNGDTVYKKFIPNNGMLGFNGLTFNLRLNRSKKRAAKQILALLT